MKRSDLDTIAGILADALNALKADLTTRIEAVAAETKSSLEAYKEVQGAKVDAAVSDIKASLMEPSVAALTRLHAAEGRMAEVERTAREAKASIKDGADAVVDHDLLLSELKAMVPDACASILPTLIPTPVPGKDADEDAIKAAVLDSLQPWLKETKDEVIKSIPDPIPGPALELDEDDLDERVQKAAESLLPAAIEQSERVYMTMDGIVEKRLPGLIPAPIHGKDADPRVVAAVLLESDGFTDSLKGAKGDKGDPGPAHPLVSIRNLVDAEVADMLPGLIPEPIKGDAAEPVDYDSIHKHIDSTIENAVPEYVAKIAHDLKGEPGISVTPEMIEEAVTVHLPAIREAIVEATKLFKVRGTYKDDAIYEIGDVVIRSGSSYVKTKEGDFPPPSSSWQMWSQGKPGNKGGPGDQGKPGARGIGIKSMSIEGTVLITIMDDGTVHELDLTETLIQMYTENGDDE